MAKLTPAQSAELHIAVSGVLTLLAGVATTIYQSGNPSLGVALGTLTAALGVSFVSIMHAMMTSKDAPQALKDTEQDIVQAIPQLATWIEGRLTAHSQALMAHITATHAQPVTIAPDSDVTASMPKVTTTTSA